MTDLIGQTIGQYLIIEEIGRGGMATVYRGFQARIGRDVAIKVLPAQFTHDPTFLARFTREVEIAARLQHHRILPVYDYGEFEGQPYIVMAYMPGGNLEERIAEGSLPPADALRLVEQIAEGLDYLHAGGIIHRDFKPSNVLLDASGSAFLSDFGIARVQEATAHLTGTGIIGTPAYMAPEMFREGAASPASDIYALGVTLYEMLSGTKPFDAETPVQYMRAHLEKPVPDARHIIPDLPVAVQRVIAMALAKDPAARYQSAGAMAAALKEAIRPRPAKIARRNVPIWPLAALGGVIMLGIVVAGLFFVLRGGQGVQIEPTAPAVAAATNTPMPADMPAPIVAPTETPLPPPLGGGTGILGFNANGFGYTVNVDCALTRRPGCDSLPHILPASGNVSPVFGQWSPDGRLLAYIADEMVNNEGDVGYNSSIHLDLADGSLYAQIPDEFVSYDDLARGRIGRLWSPENEVAWSPDGKFVAVYAGQEGDRRYGELKEGVSLVNIDCIVEGQNYRDCLAHLYGDSYQSGGAYSVHFLRWSPNGEHILFNEQFAAGGLFVIDRDGGNRLRLPFSEYIKGAGYWMPDSERILYYAPGGLMIASADGSSHQTIPLGITPYSVLQPPIRLSPDGRYLALDIMQNVEDRELYLLDLACLESGVETCPDALGRITDNEVDDILGAWSPDGTLLAFARADYTEVEIHFADHHTYWNSNTGLNIYVLDVPRWLAGAGDEAITQITTFGLVGTESYAGHLNPRVLLEWQPAPGN